jgi:hypothetical protein
MLCHYAQYRYAECRYAEYRYAQCHYAECHDVLICASVRVKIWHRDTQHKDTQHIIRCCKTILLW